MRKVIFLTLILSLNFCTAQSDQEKNLIGKWILVEETDSFDDEIEPLEETNSDSGSDQEADLKTILIFNKDKTISISQMGNEYNASYQLTDSILTLGKRHYIIVLIEEKKLIYKDKDGLFDNHYKYHKIE